MNFVDVVDFADWGKAFAVINENLRAKIDIRNLGGSALIMPSVVTGRGDNVVDSGQFLAGQCPAQRWPSAWLWYCGSRVVVRWEDVVANGMYVDGAYGGEQVFAGAVASAVGASDESVVDDLPHEGFDVGGVDVVEWPVAESGDDVGPVGAVRAVGAWAG